MPGNDLGSALISLVRDIQPGLLGLISIVCYLLATGVFLHASLRLLRHSEGGPRAPSGLGTGAGFLVCVVLATLPSWLAGGGESLFGAAAGPERLGLGYGSRGAEYDELLDAVFTLVQLIGLIAFVRGLFVLRSAADGGPGVGAAGAFAHMLGGVAAWHIRTVISAVQTTLGITVFDVST